MQDLVEDILNDIYILDPSLKEQEAEVRVMVLAFLAAKPRVTVDKQFASNLRKSLTLSKKVIEKKPTPSYFSSWIMYLTPIGVATLIIFMLLPDRPASTALPVPAVMEDSVESEMVPELYNASNAKRSADVGEENSSMMMQMSADSLPSDSFGVGTQMPSNKVLVDFASLSVPGFLVIQKSDNGAAGEIIGISPFLVTGLTEQIEINLSITTQDDQTFYATLYFDNGDGLFKEGMDLPVMDASGSPLYQLFSTSPELLE